jgi:hypothetical protein
MYLKSILFYLTWPLLILICYYVILFALKQFEKKTVNNE